jgi:hypothetical protein
LTASITEGVGQEMRFVTTGMWAILAVFSLLVTFGNAAVAQFQQSAEAGLHDADFGYDIYRESSFAGATRWVSACLTDSLLVRKELQLKQLDLIYGHGTVADTNQKLAQAHAFIVDYLHCNPGDGSAWLAAAMVMNTMNNDSDVTMQYLALSKFYTPRGENAVRSRQVLLQRVSPRLRDNYRDLLIESDAVDNNASGVQKP